MMAVEFQQNIAAYYRAIRMELLDALTNVRLGEVVHIAAPPA
jgi:hypothetical protein